MCVAADQADVFIVFKISMVVSSCDARSIQIFQITNLNLSWAQAWVHPVHCGITTDKRDLLI